MATEINAGRVAMVPKGEWSASTAYVRLDVVYYNGSSYVASQDSTGQNPSTATNYWQLLSSGLDPTVDTIAAKHYEGSTVTAETSISASGVISKTASGVTKTFNLPAESGTLARKEETLPNKTYAPLEFSGLGRKYLQKNIVSNKNVLTQAMFQDENGNALENTIFVIQYDYDLNQQTVNVPAETTLKFEGGSIKNGTLNFGKGVLVESEDVKIFDDVLFTGDCGGQYFHIDWFVANYAQTIADTEPDATEEIQAMFDCGIKRVWLTNKHHYRITGTITVDASINICGEAQKNFDKDNATNKYIFSSIQQPLFTIKANKPNAYYVNYSVTIDNIYLYRLISGSEVTIANNYKRDTPTLYIDCTEGSIWGLYIKCFINQSIFKTIYYPADGTTEKNEWGLGYGGVEIYAANGNYATYINIGGYIRCYETMHIHKDNSSAWITAVDLKYDSIAVYGGRICCGVNSLIGEHQSTHLLPAGNTDGFFEIQGRCQVAGGEIFDTSFGTKVTSSTEDKLYSVNYSIKADYITGADTWWDLYSKNCVNIKQEGGHGIYGNASLAANLIPDVFYNMKYGFKGAGNLRNIVFRAFSSQSDFDDYENGDTTAGTELTEETVVGYAYLFYPDKIVPDSSPGTTPSFNRKSYMRDNMAVKALLFKCDVNLVYATIIINSICEEIESISIDNGSGEYVVFTSFRTRFRPIYVPLNTAWGSKNVKIKLIYKNAVQNYDLPYIGICVAGAGNLIGSWGGSVYGDLSTNRLSSTEFSVDKITDVTNIETPVVNNYYKRTMLSKQGIIPIGDGGGQQTQIAHIQYTKGGYNIMQLSFIEAGRRWDMHIYRTSSSNATIVRGVAQTMDGQAFYTYEKDLGNGLVDLVITANLMSACLLLDVWGNTKPTVIDNMVTVDTTGYTQTKASMDCIRQSWTFAIDNGHHLGDVYMSKDNGLFARWNGSKWIEFDGATSNVKRRGATSDRPSSADIYIGFIYFDTTLGVNVVWNGTTWVQQNALQSTDFIPESGGLLPNVLYHFGVTDNPTITLNTTDIDPTIANEWQFTFIAKTSACAVSLPSDVLLANGFSWDMEAFRCFHVSIKQIPSAGIDDDYHYPAVYMATVDYIDITPEKNYLTIESLGSGNVTITIPADVDSSKMTSISYSKDRVNWADTTIDNTAQTITIPVVAGDKVFIKGIGKTTYGTSSPTTIGSSANYELSGNIMSLLYGDNFAGQTTFPTGSVNTFYGLFKDSTTLKSASHLCLPATTLVWGAYTNMFISCTGLTDAPQLPATTLATNCYYSMFYSCSSLVNAPALPATTLATGCYTSMFRGCRAMVTTPTLAADTLVNKCYKEMFRNCNKVNSITMLATDISATECLDNWLNGVATTGTFVKAASMTSLPSGTSGIPNGWSVEDVSE